MGAPSPQSPTSLLSDLRGISFSEVESEFTKNYKIEKILFDLYNQFTTPPPIDIYILNFWENFYPPES